MRNFHRIKVFLFTVLMIVQDSDVYCQPKIRFRKDKITGWLSVCQKIFSKFEHTQPPMVWKFNKDWKDKLGNRIN